jgi:hypothetical protein
MSVVVESGGGSHSECGGRARVGWWKSDIVWGWYSRVREVIVSVVVESGGGSSEEIVTLDAKIR